jgi:hypothetical protein
MSIVLFGAADVDYPDHSITASKNDKAVVSFAFDGTVESVTITPASVLSPRACAEPVSVDLGILLRVLTLSMEEQEAYCLECLHGRYDEAVAFLEAKELPAAISGTGASLYRAVKQNPVAVVCLGSVIAKLAFGAKSLLLTSAVAELRSDSYLGTLVVLALGHTMHAINARLAGHLFASRLLSALVSSGEDLPREYTFERPQPDQPVWVAVFKSDDRHPAAGGSLAKSSQAYIKTLFGTSFSSTARVKVLYQYGPKLVPSSTPKSDDFARVLNLEGLLSETIDGGAFDQSVPKDVAAWASKVSSEIETRSGELEIDVVNRPRNRFVQVRPGKGYFFVFAWAEDLFETAIGVMSDLLERLGVSPEPCWKAMIDPPPVRSLELPHYSDEEGSPTVSVPAAGSLWCGMRDVSY